MTKAEKKYYTGKEGVFYNYKTGNINILTNKRTKSFIYLSYFKTYDLYTYNLETQNRVHRNVFIEGYDSLVYLGEL